jgi:hypothetical protein
MAKRQLAQVRKHARGSACFSRTDTPLGKHCGCAEDSLHGWYLSVRVCNHVEGRRSASEMIGAQRQLSLLGKGAGACKPLCSVRDILCVHGVSSQKNRQQILKEPHASVVQGRSALSVASSYLVVNSCDSLARRRTPRCGLVRCKARPSDGPQATVYTQWSLDVICARVSRMWI